jgi:phage terminase small subunit
MNHIPAKAARLMRVSSFDRGEQARQAIALDGALIATDAGGVKAHPAVTIERDSRIAFARLLRELDLDGTAIDGPPALKSNRG